MKTNQPEKPQLAICVGPPKTATTWLYKCLEEHPDVCCAKLKETRYFSDKRHTKDTDYHDLFNHCKHKKVHFEATPNYLSYAGTPEKIFSYDKNVKIIIIVRNQIERAFSQYLHYIHKKNIAKHQYSIEEHAQKSVLVERGLYGKHLSRYLKLFPEHQIYLLNYSEIDRKPQNAIDGLCCFLNIDKFSPSIVSNKYHSTKARSSPFYFKLTTLYFRLHGLRLGRFSIRILKFLGLKSIHVEKMIALTAKNKTEMTETEAKFLSNLFASDKEKFINLICKSQSINYSDKSKLLEEIKRR